MTGPRRSVDADSRLADKIRQDSTARARAMIRDEAFVRPAFPWLPHQARARATDVMKRSVEDQMRLLTGVRVTIP